jgi:hypothetical protein
MTAEIARLGDPDLSFWLTRSVARTVGINLSEAMTRGRLSAQGYGEMVTRCRKCPHAEACTAWLAVNGAGAARVPDHCANAPALNALLPVTT